MLRPLAILPLLLVASAAIAADYKVSFEEPIEDGTVVGYVSKGTPSYGMAPTFSVNDTSSTFKSSESGDARVFFADAKKNIVVSRKLGELKMNPKISFSKPEYLFVSHVKLSGVDRSNGGISVSLKDADRTQTQLLNQEKEATFAFVAIGQATAAAKFRDAKNESHTVEKSFDVSGDGLGDFSLDLASNGEATATSPDGKATATASTPPGAPPAGQSTGSGFLANLIGIVFGLAVIGGVAVAIWQYTRREPEKVKQALNKIGVDVPEPLDEDEPATVPAAPKAPEPPSTIILDPATSDPGASGSNAIELGGGASVPASPAAIAATGIPALLGNDGSTFEIPDGETTVGRTAIGGLIVDSDTVSRAHAKLTKSGGNAEVEDLGSTNGTWVNGRKISGSTPLQSGDRLQFGSVEYTYRG